jgi:hypothetical protein
MMADMTEAEFGNEIDDCVNGLIKMADEMGGKEHPSGAFLIETANFLELVRSQSIRNYRLVNQHAAEVNRRRDEMSALRELLRENGVEVPSLVSAVNHLLIYKRAMDSMASQMVHPKMTGLDMAQMQLRTERKKPESEP